MDQFINNFIIKSENFKLNLDKQKIIINSQIFSCNEIINYYKKIIPELFYKDKIIIPKNMYEEIVNFILSINTENFNPIFFTPNLNDEYEDDSRIKVFHNKEDFNNFINLLKIEF
jgi:hypothetical protein